MGLIGNIGTLLFIKDKKTYQENFALHYEIIKNKYTNEDDVTDYGNWGIGFGRRFNSLKLFYAICEFGKEGL